MKLYLLIILFFVGTTHLLAQPALCCPEFKLSALFQPCNRESCNSDHLGSTTPQGTFIIACKNQPHTYVVTPNQAGYTYTWTVTSGTPTSFVGNPAVITWGNSGQGTIQVIITSADGQCRDTLKQAVCIVDAPTAAFTYSPNPVCVNGTVCFNSTPSVGANYYHWDFGDGTSSTLPNPCHTYTSTSGNPYTVVLTVSASDINSQKTCDCRDTAQAKITVNGLSGIDIHTDDCREMLCSGDIVTYCTSTTGCTGLNWVVNGGTILSGQGSTCVTVAWNQPSIFPTSVTLNANCSGSCGNTATLNVPVLYPHLPIQGLYIVCPNTTSTYSLPALPGTFYTWTIDNPAGTIAPIDRNHNNITVNWNSTTGGPYIIKCDYENPYSGCKGTDTIAVFIKPKFQVSGLTALCANTNATYGIINGGGANFDWHISPISSSAYTPSGSPTGTFLSQATLPILWNTAGNYTITAEPIATNTGNYCNASSITSVTVNPIPVLNSIVGDAVVCLNQVYTYSATSNVSGGTYQWIFTSGTGTIAPYGANNAFASIIFTGAGPWVLQATQTVNGCVGTKTMSITKASVPPTITLSPSTICSGGTITASVSGAVPFGGYTWSTTAGAILTGGQGTATATFTVNSNATISLTSCGGTVSANVTTTIQTVSIASTPSTCGATLSASPSGGTYNWFLNGNPIAIGSGISLGATQNGNYVVQANFGTCVAAASIAVTNITPIATNISWASGNVCNGNSATLVATIPANCPSPVFTWSPGGFTGNPFVTSTPGSYSVKVSCANGCSAVSNVITLGCSGGGIGDNDCLKDLGINASNCANPVNLTTNVPAGCTGASPITWSYGDGTFGTTGTHLYSNPGVYFVGAVMTCGGAKHCDTAFITVPMVDSFTSVVTCGASSWNILLQDASMFLPAYAGYTRTWSTTCGTLSSLTSANPTLSVPFGCNPIVTLIISKNGCTLSHSFNFNLPTTPLAILGPSPVCIGSVNAFSSNFTSNVLTYFWDFGDGSTGVTNPISHAFYNTGSSLVTLTITDKYGCTFKATRTILINVPTPLTISPSPIVRVCPDCLPPTLLTTSPAGFTGYRWFQNGAAIIPPATGSTFALCNVNATGNYYVTATSSNSCPATSNIVQVIYKPKPIADIQGSSSECVGATGPYFTTLQNKPGFTSGYTYLWTGTGPSAVVFTTPTQYSTNVSVNALGTYQFILTVRDTLTGCMAKDTLCVTYSLSPTVTITAAPSGDLCAGTLRTLTANPLPAPSIFLRYLYQWNTTATTQSITTAQAGVYTVGVLNPATGCTAGASITIKKQPYLALFPIGCDTLCDTSRIIPPLPLATGQASYAGVYTIQWFVDNVFHSTGPSLNLATLPAGPHQIYIIVTEIATGCSDKSGIYNVYIKHCIDCCPHDIKIDSIRTVYVTSPTIAATVFGAVFNISGLSTTNLTEVRANVISYTLSDNYATECMKCQNFPYTWGSMAYGAITVPPMLAKITMYGGTTTTFFNGSGVGKYQNPREAVWNNGTIFNIPNHTPAILIFLLPQIPIIDCCELKGNICVKLTFRDTNCKECEEIVCFPFVLKKGIITPLMNSSPLSKGSFIPNGLFQK